MKPRIGDVTFNATNPPLLASFWAAVMGYEIQEADETFALIADSDRRVPRFVFQQLVTPKTHRNRIHLDLYVTDMEAEVERIVALGASKLRVSENEGVIWTVMLDPEGNEFCVQPEM